MLLREILLDKIRQCPILFYTLTRQIKRYNNVLINKDTEIVIEGYPRSANTFAVAALEVAQQRKIKVARHTHAIAQIKVAARQGLPTIILVRKPKDAILSYVIREKNVTLSLAINRYKAYYSAVRQLQDNFHIARFEDVTSNYGAVIKSLNKKYSTNFLLFQHTDKNVSDVFERVEEMEREISNGELSESKVARPSNKRKDMKASLEIELQKNKYTEKLEHCNKIYQQLIS